MTLNSNNKLELQPDLTSSFSMPARAVIRAFILSLLLASGGCSTYFTGEKSNGDQGVERPSNPILQIDLSKAKWQKLTPGQPDTNPLRVAIIERDNRIGATRVALKASANTPIPPHWHSVQGSYTVLRGVFVFDGVNAKGQQERTRRRPGDFATLPANYILRLTAEGPEEAILYFTFYGDWSPQFQSNPWGKPALRGAH